MFKGIDAYKNLAAIAPTLKAEGLAFVARYLFASSAFKQRLNPVEAQAISAAGLNLVTVWENGSPTQDSYFTESMAEYDAKNALHWARAATQPTGTVIFFAVDGDVSPAVAEVYFRSLAPTIVEGGYKVGVYGSGAVCKRLRAANLVAATWLSQSHGWTGYQDWLPHADIVQGPVTHMHGLDVDTDTAASLDLVSWHLP